MNKTANINNKENVITVDCKNEKVYFNGNEVVKMSMGTYDSKFNDDPFQEIYDRMFKWSSNVFEHYCEMDDLELLQRYLDDDFRFNALVYRDKNTNKEHLIQNYNGEWLKNGKGWDSIILGNWSVNDWEAFAYGISGKKKVKLGVKYE